MCATSVTYDLRDKPIARQVTPGEVAEWSNVPDSKSGVRFSRTVGSNPTLSAKNTKKPSIKVEGFLLGSAVLYHMRHFTQLSWSG